MRIHIHETLDTYVMLPKPGKHRVLETKRINFSRAFMQSSHSYSTHWPNVIPTKSTCFRRSWRSRYSVLQRFPIKFFSDVSSKLVSFTVWCQNTTLTISRVKRFTSISWVLTPKHGHGNSCPSILIPSTLRVYTICVDVENIYVYRCEYTQIS